MKILRAEDLDLFVRNYYVYQEEIEKLKEKIQVIVARLNPTSSLVKVSKGSPSETKKKLRSKHTELVAELKDLEQRREEVDKFMVWALAHPDEKEYNYYKIVMYRTMGYGWLDIGDFVNLSHSGAKIRYERLINEYFSKRV